MASPDPQRISFDGPRDIARSVEAAWTAFETRSRVSGGERAALLRRLASAQLVTGGNRLGHEQLAGGFFIEPTVFAGVDNSMRIAREEVFGRVASLILVSGEDEAVAIANDTTYGQTAGLRSCDVGRGHRVSARVEAGIVWVNTYRYIRWSTPYGCLKGAAAGDGKTATKRSTTIWKLAPT